MDITAFFGCLNPESFSPFFRAHFSLFSRPAVERKIIDADGVKLQELNLLPDGLVMPLVSLDVYCFIISNPEASGDEIIDFLKWSLYHHLRGRRAGLLNKVIPLAQKEYEVSNQGDGYSGGMTG